MGRASVSLHDYIRASVHGRQQSMRCIFTGDGYFRRKGTHLLEPMKAIVKELMGEGKTVEEIGKQLGMKPEEVFRLSDFSKEDFLNMMTKGVTGFSKAEYLTKI